MSVRPELQALMSEVNQLPTLPAELAELLETISHEDVDIDSLAARIGLEQSLVARLLRVANSPFYGMSGKVDNVQQAMNVLGLANTQAIITALVVMARLPMPASAYLDMVQFWQHTLAVAAGSQLLAQCLHQPAGTAFTAGLLHDVGKVVTCAYRPDAYRTLMQTAHAQDISPTLKEQEILGFTHAELGAALAESWRFPAPITQAIAWHDDPWAHDSTLADIVHVANLLSHALELGRTDWDAVPDTNDIVWDRLALSDEALLNIMRNTRSQTAALSALL